MTSVIAKKEEIERKSLFNNSVRNRSNSQAQRSSDRLDKLKYEFILNGQLSFAPKKQAAFSPSTSSTPSPPRKLIAVARTKSPTNGDNSPDPTVKNVQDQLINALKSRLSGSFEPIEENNSQSPKSTAPSQKKTNDSQKAQIEKKKDDKKELNRSWSTESASLKAEDSEIKAKNMDEASSRTSKRGSWVNPAFLPQASAVQMGKKYGNMDKLPSQVIAKITSYLPLESLIALSEVSLIMQQKLESASIWGSSQTLREMLQQFIVNEQRNIANISVSPEFEVERTKCLLRILAYLKKLRNNEEYISALNKLVEYHLSLKNHVEAALVVLLHADLYTWKPESSSTKEALYHNAVKYFGDGKYWELGISLLQELRSIKQNVFKTPSENIDTEREYLRNIRYKDRFFEEYFFVEYFGTGFPPEYLNKKFVYRGVEAEKLGNFVARIMKRFPNCQVLHNDPTEELMNSNVQAVRIRTCKPSSLEETRGEKRQLPDNLPSLIKNFHRNTNINTFLFSASFKKPVQGAKNEFQELWIKNTFVSTKDAFPTIHRCSQVIERIEVELSPIESSIKVVQDKNDEISGMIERTEITGEWKSSLSMALKGVIDAAVNGGTTKYKEAFFSEDFKKNATEKQNQFILVLKSELVRQTEILSKGLRVHSKVMPENMVKLQEQLENQFAVMKADATTFISNKE